ncbi:MAG: SGNH/GDSL hydrolase family protein [Mycobacteriales bacterium]
MRGLVALGDSFSCGEGVGVRTRPDRTWSARLATAIGADYHALAVAGARVRDVRARQLPVAIASGAGYASLLVGLNDVIRADFRPAQVDEDVRFVVRTLSQSGIVVLLCRLHDPLTQLRGQRALAAVREPLGRRLRVVNDAVDQAASENSGVLVLDLAGVAPLRERECWAVDRLHPADRGHEALAAAGLRALGRGHEAPVCEAGTTVGALTELRWLVQHALPWTATHVGRVVLPAARMMFAGG